MSHGFTLDVRQAAELANAFERCGYTNEDIKRMLSGTTLEQFLPVLRGKAEVTRAVFIIDCDADPVVPYVGWTVYNHLRSGKVTFDLSNLDLYLSKHQLGQELIEGYELRKELAGLACTTRPCNAKFLDFLLVRQHLIPEEWKVDELGKTRHIYFWGTVYGDEEGKLYVRYLYFSQGYWQTEAQQLSNVWSSRNPALVLVS